MWTMRVEGGEELAQALSALSTRVTKNVVREALWDGAEPTRKGMSQRAARAPGAPDIADNMGISNARVKGDTAGDIAAVAIGPTKGFFYGLFLEYGTIHMGAQPFARPTFDSETPKAIGIISQELWRQLAGRGITRSATVNAPIGGDRIGGSGFNTGKPAPRKRKKKS